MKMNINIVKLRLAFGLPVALGDNPVAPERKALISEYSSKEEAMRDYDKFIAWGKARGEVALAGGLSMSDLDEYDVITASEFKFWDRCAAHFKKAA